MFPHGPLFSPMAKGGNLHPWCWREGSGGGRNHTGSDGDVVKVWFEKKNHIYYMVQESVHCFICYAFTFDQLGLV